MIHQFAVAALATISGFALVAFIIFCERLFNRSYDDYPIKYYGKTKQRPGKGATDIVPTDPYSEIINDYPTYHRQVK